MLSSFPRWRDQIIRQSPLIQAIQSKMVILLYQFYDTRDYTLPLKEETRQT
jgi:hypothetical protein